MLKGFRIKGVDGGHLHIEEVEDKESVKVCIDHSDSQSSVCLDYDAFNELTNLRHKMDVNYPKEKGEGKDGSSSERSSD